MAVESLPKGLCVERIPAAVGGKNTEPGRAPRRRLCGTMPAPPGPAPVRRIRARRGQALREHQAAQNQSPVPGVLPLPCAPSTPDRPDRNHLRQLQPHLTTKRDARVGGNGLRRTTSRSLTHRPTRPGQTASLFTAPRYFALDGTDHASDKEQADVIRRYIIWHNNHAYDQRLCRLLTGQT